MHLSYRARDDGWLDKIMMVMVTGTIADAKNGESIWIEGVCLDIVGGPIYYNGIFILVSHRRQTTTAVEEFLKRSNRHPQNIHKAIYT